MLNSCVYPVAEVKLFHYMWFCLQSPNLPMPPRQDFLYSWSTHRPVQWLFWTVLVNPQKGGDVYRGRKRQQQGWGAQESKCVGRDPEPAEGPAGTRRTAPTGARHAGQAPAQGCTGAKTRPCPAEAQSWECTLSRIKYPIFWEQSEINKQYTIMCKAVVRIKHYIIWKRGG